MKSSLSILSGIMFAIMYGQAVAHEDHEHAGHHDRKHSEAADMDMVHGVVFHDRNENGVRDRGEPGIPGVSVSNGVDVVRTGGRGEYSISLAPESILFISKPAEYDVPVDENNLPQFYYIHYPEGTPAVADWKYDVIEPTGPLPKEIDFPLLAAKVERKFNAMAFADPQAKTGEEQDMVREDVVNELMGNPFDAKFGITAGDVVYDTLSLYERHNRMFGQIGIPMWNVPGNHDLNYPSPNDKYATQTFIKHFGPTYYSFDYGRIHVVGLNNVQYKGAGQGKYDNTSYRGYISEEQLEWLENDLKYVDRDKLIIIATHIPLITYALDGKGERYAMGDNINTVNFDKLLEVLEPFDNIYAIAGHDTSNSWKVEVNHTHGWHGTPWISHTLAEVRGNGWNKGPRDNRDVRDSTMQDGNPNGYYVMHFDGTEVQPRFIPSGQKANLNQRMRIMLDPMLEGTVDFEGKVTAINRGMLVPGTKLVVNLFDGGERDSVQVSLDKSDFVSMVNVVRNDPLMVREYAKYKGTPDAFSSPAPSSHIWEYELPYWELGAGLHTVVVKTSDEFGQTAEDSFTFELLAN